MTIRAALSVHVVSPWESFLIGIILGAFVVRWLMIDQWMQWVNVDATVRAGWIDGHHLSKNGTLGLLDNIPCHPHTTKSAATRIEQAVHQLISREDHIELYSEQTDIVAESQTMNHSVDENSIELEDLDELEDYLYGDSPETTISPESGEAPQSPTNIWKPSHSVDAIMRPIHDMFAPQLQYQPMDHDLSTAMTALNRAKNKNETYLSGLC
jgi:hypothetical protein